MPAIYSLVFGYSLDVISILILFIGRVRSRDNPRRLRDLWRYLRALKSAKDRVLPPDGDDTYASSLVYVKVHARPELPSFMAEFPIHQDDLLGEHVFAQIPAWVDLIERASGVSVDVVGAFNARGVELEPGRPVFDLLTDDTVYLHVTGENDHGNDEVIGPDIQPPVLRDLVPPNGGTEADPQRAPRVSAAQFRPLYAITAAHVTATAGHRFHPECQRVGKMSRPGLLQMAQRTFRILEVKGDEITLERRARTICCDIYGAAHRHWLPLAAGDLRAGLPRWCVTCPCRQPQRSRLLRHAVYLLR